MKYVPDMTRSLIGLLQTMRDRRISQAAKKNDDDVLVVGDAPNVSSIPSVTKKRRTKDSNDYGTTTSIQLSKRVRVRVKY